MAELTLEQIEWSGSLLPPPPALSKEWAVLIKKKFGEVPPHVAAMTVCPWLVRLMLDSAFEPLVHIPHRLADLIMLVVSQDNSCRHCYGATRALLRLTGYTEAQVRQIETDLHQSDLPEAYRRALDYARLLSRSNPRSGADEARRLSEVGFSREQIAEIALRTSLGVIGTRVATLTAIPIDASFEGMVGRWYTPMAKIMVRLFLRGRRRPAQAQQLPAEATQGPLAPLFGKLDGLPIAAILHRAFVESMESNILPRRTKLLLICVVARSLACPLCQSALEEMLMAEGVSQETLHEVLRNLASPALDRREALMIPLARETVRYQQPAFVQAKMRELSNNVTSEEFMEFIGVVSMANALGRLTAVLSAL